VRERLGAAVRDVFFDRGVMSVPTLSPEHYVAWRSDKIGPFIRMVEQLKKEPARLEAYLREFRSLVGDHLVENVLRNEYLLTRATKV
jgi:hypothetical protein